MSEAPETVWIDTDGYWSGFDPSAVRDVVGQYTRYDLCVSRADLDAAVALVLEGAADKCDPFAKASETRAAIRALIQPHQADALARVRQEAHNAAIEAAADCRKWFHYPMPMPVTAEGRGPATVGVDAVEITYEVWDELICSHASFDNLPDAINEAMRLNAARAMIQPHQADALARVRQEAHNAAREVKPLVWEGDARWPGSMFAGPSWLEYVIAEQDADDWQVSFPGGTFGNYPTLEAAKAAAQADYTARIHSALALPVDGGAKG